MRRFINSRFFLRSLFVFMAIMSMFSLLENTVFASGEGYAYSGNSIKVSGGQLTQAVTLNLAQGANGPGYSGQVTVKVNNVGGFSGTCSFFMNISVNANNKNSGTVTSSAPASAIGAPGSIGPCPQAVVSEYNNITVNISGTPPTNTTPTESVSQQTVQVLLCSSKGTSAPQSVTVAVSQKGGSSNGSPALNPQPNFTNLPALPYSIPATRTIQTTWVGNPAYYVQTSSMPISGVADLANDFAAVFQVNPGTYSICAQPVLGCQTFTKQKYQMLTLDYGNCNGFSPKVSIQTKVNVNFTTTADQACNIGPFTVILKQNNQQVDRMNTNEIDTNPADPNANLADIDNGTAFTEADFNNEADPGKTYQVCLPDFQNVCKTVTTKAGVSSETVTFNVNLTDTTTICSSNLRPPTLPPPPSPPCGQWEGGECTSFTTALGAFSTDPSGFIRKIFAILLSVSGGIAVLLIIRAGYQLITSQGKPEQIQQGRDQLIAAIVGLVFLIFAFVFLQLIGYDILRIPGFGQ